MDSLIQKSLQFYFPPIFFHGIRGKFQKAFITVPVRDSVIVHSLIMILLFTYNTVYFSKLLLFSSEKLGIGTSSSKLKIDPNPN